MGIQFYNSITRAKEDFTPQDASHVKMYVCGPTVYARPHIGNARSVVVYDVLYRLLQHVYPKVTYVRNITDVDDKINAAALERGITIQALTEEVTGWFHDDMKALNCLKPTIEPKATEHVAQIIDMIERLIANGHAYVGSDGQHVLFDVTSYDDYGKLSGRNIDEQEAGARVAVEGYKKHPGDFVLWKPADAEDDESSKFDSPWGVGRPGWHIECSVMSTEYLGETFDIHGGGADLKFPHHENEIAQSCCANKGSAFAKYWVHNGFLTVEGEKMSKSLGNFITVRDLLDKGIKGEVIRLALLMSKYNEPLDWSDEKVREAEKFLDGLYRFIKENLVKSFEDNELFFKTNKEGRAVDAMWAIKDHLDQDMNTPAALSAIRITVSLIKEQKESLSKETYDRAVYSVLEACRLLGLLQQDPAAWFKGDASDDDAEIEAKIQARIQAKQAKDWATSDQIRDELKAQGIILEDRPDGTTDWRRA
ncbi:MAG: cysteine--tRNA ligase [Rickettsiales bacterium]|nr:cysteine--tRNA ligase [Rickettsiales bacterium]